MKNWFESCGSSIAREWAKSVSVKHLSLQVSSRRYQWFHRSQNTLNYSHMQISHRNRNRDQGLILGRISLPLLSHLLPLLFSQVLHPWESAGRQRKFSNFRKNNSWLELHLEFGLRDLLCLGRSALCTLHSASWAFHDNLQQALILLSSSFICFCSSDIFGWRVVLKIQIIFIRRYKCDFSVCPEEPFSPRARFDFPVVKWNN